MKKGFLITFEGPEGSGKTTQIQRAEKFLRRKGYSVVLFREPGGTDISEAIRAIILNKKFTKMAAETELLLYLACRAQIIREKIMPALQNGRMVICDRFEDSTLAYQGFGRGLDISKILQVSQDWVRGDLKPDLTFLLNIDAKAGMKRGGREDRMERQSYAFHSRVQQGFLTLAKQDPDRFCVVDASLPMDEVTRNIQERLSHVF